MDHEKKLISLNNLILDNENARHGELSDQSEILKWMSTGKDKQKLYELAKEISKKGLSPIELPMAIPSDESDGVYIVVEGNRRISAVKMLRDLQKCPDDAFRKKLAFLQKNSVSLPSKIECVVVPDLEAAEYWIRLRHGGQQEGAGVVNWGTKEFNGFSERMGKKGPNHASMSLMNYALHSYLISQEEYEKIPVTNVTRLINSPDVRRQMGMDVRKKDVFLVSDKGYFDIAVRDVLKALSSSEWTVSKLKELPQRQSFIDGVKKDGKWGSYTVIDPVSIADVYEDSHGSKALGVEDRTVDDEIKGSGTLSPASSPMGAEGGADPVAADDPSEASSFTPMGNQDQSSDDQEDPKQPRKRSYMDPSKRKYILPSSFVVKVENKRLRSIYNELRKFDGEFLNAVSVLTRVFIEGCLDAYILKHSLECKERLTAKAQCVRNHICQSNGNTQEVKDDMKSLEYVCGDHSHFASAQTMNSLVHNLNFNITERDLKIIWDGLEKSFKWLEGHV